MQERSKACEVLKVTPSQVSFTSKVKIFAEELLKQVHKTKTKLFEHWTKYLVSQNILQKCSVCSDKKDYLARIAFGVCCQGGKSGMFRSFDMPSCKEINTRASQVLV